MKNKILKAVAKVTVFAAAGAISGASRMGIYQGKEPKELKKIKRF